jgi:hypothetical protein
MREDQKQQAFPDDGNFGISIGDYVAARAMQGLVTTESISSAERYAEIAYQLADAMLRAREHDTR